MKLWKVARKNEAVATLYVDIFFSRYYLLVYHLLYTFTELVVTGATLFELTRN